MLGFLFGLCGCARYQPHDPHSYCKHRYLEPRVRPGVVCSGQETNNLTCQGAVTVDVHWRCDDWSSW